MNKCDRRSKELKQDDDTLLYAETESSELVAFIIAGYQ